MGTTQLGGYIGIFLKNIVSNFRSHIKDSKWGRKYIFMNYTCCNGSPQKIPFQFANGKLPHSCCRGFWAKYALSSCEGLSHMGLVERVCNFINCTSSNRSPQEIPFQFANGKLPHSHCRGFWAESYLIGGYHNE